MELTTDNVLCGLLGFVLGAWSFFLVLDEPCEHGRTQTKPEVIIIREQTKGKVD